MLILDREPGEDIIIGEGPKAIIITVVGFRPDGRVKIGVIAPEDTLVDRREVRQAEASGWKLTPNQIRGALRLKRNHGKTKGR